MRKTIISGIIACAFGLLSPQTLPGQGTTYMSNLNQPSVGSLAVGSNSWMAGVFLAGNNFNGYTLNSVEVALSNASGNPADLRVMIYYAGIGGEVPVYSIGTLNGSLDPVSAGIYTYTPAEPIIFARNSPYAIVLTSGTAVVDGSYQWSYAGSNSYNPIGGWSTPPTSVASTWTSINGKPGSWQLTAPPKSESHLREGNLRKTIISGVIATVFGLLAPKMLPAQGTIYLSNLEQSSVGSLAVGSNSWVAGLFVTGQNPGGYVLNSVELAMANAVGNPSGLQVMIYSSGGGGYSPPAIYVGTLESSLDPVSAGVYTFTPSTPITFSPGGGYSIVLTSGTAVADGAYEWSYGGTNFYNPTGGWFTAPPKSESHLREGNLRKTIISGVIATVFGLLAPKMLPAQGTIYLSNLDQPSAGSLAVGSNSWAAGIFYVGKNSGGYMLNSVELAMNNAVGNPSGLQVMIYTVGGGGFSILYSIGTLNGSLDPVTAGAYTFTPDAPIMFLPNGAYAIVLTSGTATANGAYEWSYGSANSYNPTGGWYTLLGNAAGAWTSSNGLMFSWVRDGNAFPQFEIEATAVPEPGVLSLFALGGLPLVWRRRRAKAI